MWKVFMKAKICHQFFKNWTTKVFRDLLKILLEFFLCVNLTGKEKQVGKNCNKAWKKCNSCNFCCLPFPIGELCSFIVLLSYFGFDWSNIDVWRTCSYTHMYVGIPIIDKHKHNFYWWTKFQLIYIWIDIDHPRVNTFFCRAEQYSLYLKIMITLLFCIKYKNDIIIILY